MKTFMQTFESVVAKYGDKTALVCESRRMTYDELGIKSDTVAHFIKEKGAGDGDMIPICLSRGIDYVVAQIGVLKAGAAYVNLDAAYPKDRVVYIAKDCGAKFIIDEKFMEDAREHDNGEPGDREIKQGSRALAVYTSGSTGNPKGIVYDHGMVSSSIEAFRQMYSLSDSDVSMSMAPFSFVANLLEMLTMLSCGITVHIASDTVRKDIYAASKYMEKNRISTLFLSPQMLKRFIPPKDNSLRLVVTGSERVTNIYQKGFRIVNTYASSEALPATYFEIDKEYDNTPIGKAAPGREVFILNDEGEKVPEGEIGEICVSGNITRGYLNLPQQTEAAFVKNTLSESGEIMFRTGDLGKMLPDGNILYLNRKDWMVKINGQRVEPGEIESVIRKLDGVTNAAVKGFENEYGQTYLCGYYTSEKGTDVKPEEIRAKLSHMLPPYMIPLFVVRLEAFPINQNGKLDRKSLTPPGNEQFKADYEAPEDEVQKRICAAFEEVLKVENIGINDDFFSLGGDSIKTLLVIEKCEGLAVTPAAVFEGRTPKNISALCGGSKREKQMNPYEKFTSGQEAYPLTDSQMGVYLECAQNPQGTMYNIPFACAIPKKAGVRIEKLKDALRKVIDAYPFMKVRFGMKDGDPVLVPQKELPFDITAESADEGDIPGIKASFVKPFDIMTGPLFRFALYETEAAIHLLADFHHMISDGSSTALFLRSLSQAYDGIELKREQVSSFTLSAYERSQKQTPEYEEAGRFFEKAFAGNELDSNLMADMAEDKDLTDKPAGHFTRSLPEELSGLTHFLKSMGLTENTFFLSAFAYTLAKFTGQKEALFCTVNNGRHAPQLENTMGMLVRTLPIYAKIDEGSKIEDYLKEMQGNFFETMSHDCFSFEEIAKNYGITTDIMFVYQSDSLNKFTLNGHDIYMEMLKSQSAMSNLSLMVFKKDGGFELSFEYRSDIYREQTIKGFADMMARVMNEFLIRQHLKEVTLTGPEDLEKWREINDDNFEFDTSLSIVDMFRRQVKLSAGEPAVVYEGRTLTYAQLDSLSEALAKRLVAKGVKAETPVGIMVGRSEMFPVSALGVLKAGGAYQPLDPTYPAERLGFMLSDSKAEILICDRELSDIVPNYSGQRIYTDEIQSLPNDGGIVLDGPKPDDLFILLYTSGSTGMPKGCMMTHKNLVDFCMRYNKSFGVTREDRVCAYASFGFDAAMMDLYPYITAGACVYILPEEMRLNIAGIDEFLRKNKISIAFFTTQIGRQYATEYPENPYLKRMLTGGETLVPCDPPSYAFYNVYGPTECTILASFFEVTEKYGRVPIGRGLGNTDLYIVDAYNRALPVGVPGELCISGRLVARGYLNREDLTEEKFIENPFNKSRGYEKMYKTGDICRFLHTGQAEYVGRTDLQVKIRGFRVELTEIEAKIRKYEGIKDAVVIAGDAAGGGKQILAYVVSDSKVDVAALNEFIMEDLPYYTVPAATTQIEAIPLNPNGKVDKRKLPEPVFSSSESADSAPRPMTRLETELSDIAEKVLGHREFGVTSDLKYCGLSSLSSIKLASAVSKRFGVDLDVRKMMKGCTIISMEDDIQQRLLDRAGKASDVPADAGAKKETLSHYPLSQTQMGIYYECMKRPQDVVYNVPLCLSGSLNLDAGRLAEAVEKVIRAHPYVFAHLVLNGPDVMQTRSESLQIENLTMDDDRFEDFLASFVKPFDLFKGPLFRLAVVKTDTKVNLVMDFHHIIFDGGSLDIFMSDLRNAYDGEDIEAETYSGFEFAADERNGEGGKAYAAAEAYFDDRLKNCESASGIPYDRRGKPEDGELAESIVKMDMSKVNGFCGKHGVTPAGLFLAGVFYAVSRFSNSKDVYISTISSGRSNLKIQNSLGMFVNTLPLSANLREGLTALDFIEESGDNLTEAVSNEIYPFVKISSKYGYAPKIMYACQLGVMDEFALAGEILERRSLELNLPKFDVSVHIEERDGGVAVCAQYNSALYSRHLMDAFSESIAKTVENMMKAPGSPLKSISMVSEKQEETLSRFRRTGVCEIPEKIFHKVFENQAAHSPEKTALIAADGSFTYKELDSLANRAANGLLRLGVRQQSRVAILLPRTSRVIIAMLGVLKAGCAYIPCDPEYPAERINHVIGDSASEFVITIGERASEFENGKGIDIEQLLNGANDENPNVSVKPDDLAYLIYTSGSTGKPKGVMIKHEGICNYVYPHEKNVHMHILANEASAMLSVTTVSFDMSLKEIAGALCNGLTLVLADEDEANNPVMLAKLFERTGADAFNATASRILQYIELPAICDAFSKCRVIMAGGEQYPEALLARLKGITDARLINTYGPTEITVSSNGKDLTCEESVSVGGPLLNYIEYIADSDGNELPPHVIGELYVGGAGVARGYNNLEKMTAERFIEYKGNRVYKTGDYAMWNKSGDVVIFGRADNQVKLRGLRIELGEIEAAIGRYDGIKAAAAVIRDVNGSEHICAYYTADREIDASKLKDFLKQSLTLYMVPTAYAQLANMPMTPNGKTDIKALPTPAPAAAEEYVAPANETEKAFCDIFAKTLKLPKVGATDNFFELGGTSLMVTGVIVEAVNLKSELTYGDVFSYPTPRKLAAFLAGRGGGSDSGLANYDYGPLDGCLRGNNIETFRKGELREIGNILLTGATGFLGIHLLKEFIGLEAGKAYCMVRKGRFKSAESRLKSVLFYYFEDSFDELFGERIFVIDGDVTNKESFDGLKNKGINTVFNCAANVKHFSKGSDIEDVNLGGVLNIIDYCLEEDVLLVQTSTTSVSGFAIDDPILEKTVMNEQMLYFGQALDTKYGRSKFLAERAVLEAMAKGLSAKIMRLGNLSARETDGEFQMNFGTNSFIGRLKAYEAIGGFPYSMMNAPAELAPIDSTALAVLHLSRAPEGCCVFHPYNNHSVFMGDIIRAMRESGINIELMEDEDFAEAIKRAGEDPEKVEILSSMVAYQNMGHGKRTVGIQKSNDYTTQILYRMSYQWPVTSKDYMKRFINALSGMGFFAGDGR